MKFIIAIALGITLIYSPVLFAQKGKKTITFKQLPDTVKFVIKPRIDGLITEDSLMGVIQYSDYYNYYYTYKIFYKKKKLTGHFTYYVDCPSCMFSQGEANIQVIALYCCKDKSHNPQETAKTKSDMLEIKKKNKCSKIGICIID